VESSGYVNRINISISIPPDVTGVDAVNGWFRIAWAVHHWHWLSSVWQFRL